MLPPRSHIFVCNVCLHDGRSSVTEKIQAITLGDLLAPLGGATVSASLARSGRYRLAGRCPIGVLPVGTNLPAEADPVQLRNALEVHPGRLLEERLAGLIVGESKKKYWYPSWL